MKNLGDRLNQLQQSPSLSPLSLSPSLSLSFSLQAEEKLQQQALTTVYKRNKLLSTQPTCVSFAVFSSVALEEQANTQMCSGF